MREGPCQSVVRTRKGVRYAMDRTVRRAGAGVYEGLQTARRFRDRGDWGRHPAFGKQPRLRSDRTFCPPVSRVLREEMVYRRREVEDFPEELFVIGDVALDGAFQRVVDVLPFVPGRALGELCEKLEIIGMSEGISPVDVEGISPEVEELEGFRIEGVHLEMIGVCSNKQAILSVYDNETLTVKAAITPGYPIGTTDSVRPPCKRVHVLDARGRKKVNGLYACGRERFVSVVLLILRSLELSIYREGEQGNDDDADDVLDDRKGGGPVVQGGQVRERPAQGEIADAVEEGLHEIGPELERRFCQGQ